MQYLVVGEVLLLLVLEEVPELMHAQTALLGGVQARAVGHYACHGQGVTDLLTVTVGGSALSPAVTCDQTWAEEEKLSGEI